MNTMCNGTNEQLTANNTCNLHKIVKKLTRKLKPKILRVEDKNQSTWWEEEKVRRNSTAQNCTKKNQTIQTETEPDMLCNVCKLNYTPKIDNISAEIINFRISLRYQAMETTKQLA